MWSFQQWRRKRFLRRHRLPGQLFHHALAQLPILDRLTPAEQERLQDLASLFLHEKSIESADQTPLDPDLAIRLALLACLPILHLDLDWYQGWVSVIVYPAEFVPMHTWVDEAGVEHQSREPLIGEAWLRGPVVLSLEDIAASGWGQGHNVIIHELAHKLDGLDGEVNGLPPLHRDMSVTRWSEAFTAAFADFRQRVDTAQPVSIDPYAAEAPEEFFAVLSEVFFETPAVLHACYPAVYQQLVGFYRQDPLSCGAR